MSREQGFWARRTAGVQAEEQAAVAEVERQALVEQQAAFDEKTDAEILAELDLPDPDTLKMGDDFSAFMAKAVPDRIRRRALRTLWRSNPVLANVDMLVDYGEDFTDGATVIENMQTAYQVGKGMLKHIQEMARQAEELENPPEVEGLVEDTQEEEDVVLSVVDADKEDVVLVDPTAETGEEDETHRVPAPRRMRFQN